MPFLKVLGYHQLLGREAWRISPSGVLIGALVDVVSSFLFSIPFILFGLVRVGQLHLPAAQRHAALVEVRQSVSMRGGEWLVGAACSVLGGYIAAKIAKHDEVLNGGCSAIFSVILGVWWMFSGKDIYPMWLQLVSLVSGIAFACLGGYLRARQVGDQVGADT